MPEQYQHPSPESHDPEVLGSILPEVLRDIERREVIGELLAEQHELFGSTDPLKQERLQEVQAQIKNLSDNLEK